MLSEKTACAERSATKSIIHGSGLAGRTSVDAARRDCFPQMPSSARKLLTVEENGGPWYVH